MKMWVNWQTKITHLSRDCHQLGRVPENVGWLQEQEGTVEWLISVPRRYCSWCVGLYLIAGESVGVDPQPDWREAAERADYLEA